MDNDRASAGILLQYLFFLKLKGISKYSELKSVNLLLALGIHRMIVIAYI